MTTENGMYIIKNYDELYRPLTTKGEEVKAPTFVKMPIKPRGLGVSELFLEKNGLETFAIFTLLVEYTTELSKENRGMLLNHRNEPATLEQIARAISLGSKKSLVKKALNLLCKMGWLCYVSTTEQVRSDYGADTVSLRAKKKFKFKRSKENPKEDTKDISIINKAPASAVPPDNSVGASKDVSLPDDDKEPMRGVVITVRKQFLRHFPFHEATFSQKVFKQISAWITDYGDEVANEFEAVAGELKSDAQLYEISDALEARLAKRKDEAWKEEFLREEGKKDAEV